MNSPAEAFNQQETLYISNKTTGGNNMINFNQILFSSDISVTINEELKKCYEQLQGVDISDMTTDQLLQYMQLLYMVKLRDDISWIRENTDSIANNIADRF